MRRLIAPKNQVILILGILLLLSFSNCEKSADNSSSKINLDSLETSNYPRIDGSTSAHPLQVLIACEILDVEYSWMTGIFDETSRIWPSFEKKPQIAQFIVDSIVHNGTHSSYVNLMNGEADIIIVARRESEDEIHMADSMGLSLSTIPIALDAFVFIANTNNPVSGLSEKQIQEIYTVKIKNWRLSVKYAI